MKDRHVVYQPKNVCATEIQFDLVDGILHNVQIIGGCAGNTQGVGILAEGMRAEDVVRRLSGIDCHGGFSCPNALAEAVKECIEEGNQ